MLQEEKACPRMLCQEWRWGLREAEPEMLTATCLHSTWVAVSVHKVSRTVASAEPSTRGIPVTQGVGVGAAATRAALLRKLLPILLNQDLAHLVKCDGCKWSRHCHWAVARVREAPHRPPPIGPFVPPPGLQDGLQQSLTPMQLIHGSHSVTVFPSYPCLHFPPGTEG